MNGSWNNKWWAAALGALLLCAAMVQTASPSGAGTSLAVGAPGKGTWKITQMWHGTALGGKVPAGTGIDIAPVSGAPLDVYAVAAGTVVKTCVANKQSIVYINSTGIGVIAYVHLATGSIVKSGKVAKGQRIGKLATSFVKSSCAYSWSGTHLHLAFPRKYDAVTFAGKRAAKGAVIGAAPAAPKVFKGNVSSAMSVTASEVRVRVCANNLTGNVVRVRLSRPAVGRYPAKAWVASKRATSRCVTFANLDGAGNTYAKVTYTQRSALNQAPSTSWKGAGCFSQSRGQGLCDQARR